MSRQEALKAAARLLGTSACTARPIGGTVHVVTLDNGGTVVIKSHQWPDAVRAEVASLRWLGDSGHVRVPRVRQHDERWLITDMIPSGVPAPRAAELLGRGLAGMHLSGAEAFGSPPPGGPRSAAIGLAPMQDVPCNSWAEFYCRHRLEPYLHMAVDRGILQAGRSHPIDRVMDRIEELCGPPEPASRLHGDLWSGNVHWAEDGHAWLVDPAAHGGHRETDLAMLQLFGCPHLQVVLGAYQEQFPLAGGWERRIPLHQLFPLLVHTVLFGGGYGGRAVAAAEAALTIR